MNANKYLIVVLLHLVFTTQSEESISNDYETIIESASDTIANDRYGNGQESYSEQKEDASTKTTDNTKSYQFDIDSNDLENQTDDPKEVTLLDLFAENAKEVLTKHTIPNTNTECKWSWLQFRCEPVCNCSLFYKPGDYHLGRSCRLKQHQYSNDNEDIELTNDSNEEMYECKEWVESSSVAAKGVRFISNRLDKIDTSKVRDKIRNKWAQGVTVLRQNICTFVESKEIEFMYDICEFEDKI